MSEKNNRAYKLRIIAVRTTAAFVLASSVFLFANKDLSRELLLYDTLPYYEMNHQKNDPTFASLFKTLSPSDGMVLEGIPEAFGEEAVSTFSSQDYASNYSVESPREVQKNIARLEKTVEYEAMGGIVGSDEVIFRIEEKQPDVPENIDIPAPFTVQPEKFSDFDYLRSFYTVDKKTAFTAEDFDGKAFMEKNLKISGSGPKVLIFHTHAYEAYADSEPGVLDDGVVGVGERLKAALESAGIETIHALNRFDLVDGKVSVIGAYERMEPVIKKILAENPTIEVVIDLHRDGVNDDTRLITTVDGEKTAKVMFVNGLCKMIEGETLKPINNLENSNLKDNLAFSFQMQLTAKSAYPGLMRNIYLNAFRYSLHMVPKSLLIEVGAQTNTKQEAFNTVEPIADTLIKVLK